jgi:hypothetical protein
MTMRKLLRRRSAIRELLQNLDARPFREETQPASVGWLSRPRPRLAHGAHWTPTRSFPGGRR